MTKNIRSIITIIIAIVIVVFGVWFSLHSNDVQAAIGHNVFGTAWGATDNQGIGWISMNNCDMSGNCSGPGFGVNVDTSGVFTGEAWSSNYGWVDFQGRGGFACPGGSPTVDLAAVETNGSAPVTGFAYVSSAGSGDSYWDGCIGMSGNGTNGNWGTGDAGVTLDSNGNLTGLAWGGNVIGWVQFDATVDLVQGCTDASATNYDPLAVFDDGSCQYGGYCVNSAWSFINSPTALATYNTNNDPDLVYDSSTGLCALLNDVCPDNNNSMWNGVQTQSWFNNYNANNDPDIVYVSGYCVIGSGTPSICPTDPLYIANPQNYIPDQTLCSVPCSGAACVTIPVFEEI